MQYQYSSRENVQKSVRLLTILIPQLLETQHSRELKEIILVITAEFKEILPQMQHSPHL